MNSCVERTNGTTEPRPKLRGEIPTNPQPEWLYDAVRATVHPTRGQLVTTHERGVAKVIADALGCAPNVVTDLADPTRRVALKAHQIPDIVRATGSFEILDALEAQVGRVGVRLPATVPASFDSLEAAMGRTMRAMGSFVEKHGAAMHDGRLNARERKELHTLTTLLHGLICEYDLIADTRVATKAARA